MGKYRNKEYHIKNRTEGGKVIFMEQALVKDLPLHKEKSPIGPNHKKKSKLDIVREISNEVSFYGTAFGRNMREHYKQGR